MTHCNPPAPRCRGCQIAGLVPFLDDMPPPDSPVALGEFPAAASAPTRCTRLGTEPVGLRDCPTCAGRVRKKEFACALGLGMAGRAVPSEDCGPGRCPGYAPAADATSSA